MPKAQNKLNGTTWPDSAGSPVALQRPHGWHCKLKVHGLTNHGIQHLVHTCGGHLVASGNGVRHVPLVPIPSKRLEDILLIGLF